MLCQYKLLIIIEYFTLTLTQLLAQQPHDSPRIQVPYTVAKSEYACFALELL